MPTEPSPAPDRSRPQYQEMLGAAKRSEFDILLVSVRIISDELFQRAQERNWIRSNSDTRMKSGGRPKYLLSGLLHCGICNAHYILHDARSYACSGHKGGACDNHIRVRRDALESAILGPLRNEMLAPERVAQMAKEMHRAEYKRRELAEPRPTHVSESANLLTILPNAAEL
jgi:hypothetical protein